MVTQIKQAAKDARETSNLFTSPVEEADRAPRVPLQSWLRTVSGVSDVADDDAKLPEKDILSRIMSDIAALRPHFARDKPIPSLAVSALGFPLDGWFSVWKIGIAGGQWRQQQTFALYVGRDDVAYTKSAQRLWDELASGKANVTVMAEVSDYGFSAIEAHAESEASDLYDALVEKTRIRDRRRRDALEMSYLARRTALISITSEDTRALRRKELETEYQQRKSEVAHAHDAIPELDCLFLAHVVAT